MNDLFMPADPKPEERHHDFQVQTELIAKAVMLIGKVITPLATAGLLMLVANHFQQKQLATDLVEVTQEMKEIRRETTLMSHKLAVIWATGDYEKRYHTDK